VAFHGGVMKKYNGGRKEVVSRRDARGPFNHSTNPTTLLKISATLSTPNRPPIPPLPSTA
jgi:hypothetical protein